MSIDTQRLTPVDFCIMVLWVYGLTTGQVHDLFARNYGKSKAAVRGVINRIPSRRDTMTRQDRQRFLDQMKEARIDDDKLEDQFFRARALKSDAVGAYGPPTRQPKRTEAKVKAAPDLTTRKGRKEAKRIEKEREREDAERKLEQEDRERGGAPRGAYTYPLEHLRFSGLLQDKNQQVKGSLKKTANEESRFVAGWILRSMFDASQLVGIKSQQYEILGSSSNRGFSISFRVLQARKGLADLRQMLGPERFKVMELLLRDDAFVWHGRSPDNAEAVLEAIRCGLDCFSVYDCFMPIEDFAARWGFSPEVLRGRSKSEAMEISREARSIIAEAQRSI